MPGMRERRVTSLFDHVDFSCTSQMQLLEHLVSIDSGTDDKAGVDRVGAILAAELDALGCTVETVRQETLGDHVVARKSGRAGADVLLVGHLDTVFPAGTVAVRPFTILGDRAFGPGVYDMRGGLAVLVYALRALRAASPAAWQDLGLRIVLNSDEEPGSDTSRDLIAAEAQQAGMACILEPARAGGEYVCARKGVSRYVVSIHGIAAHSGNQPHLGASAVSELAAKIGVLDSLNGAEAGLTVNVGVVRGGTRVNMVPDFAECEVEMRLPTISSLRLVEDAVARLELPIAVKRTQTAVTGGVKQYPMEARADRSREWQMLSRVGDELGLKVSWIATGAASDGNTTSRFVPTLDGMGPVGDRAHSPDEYIVVSSVPERTKMLARFLEVWSSEQTDHAGGRTPGSTA